MYKIAIVGGGAAGMMCAANLLEKADSLGILDTIQIHLFEKNSSIGKKVAITGGGRCNITTGITDKKTLLSKYTRGADFFKQSLGKFSPKKTVEWYESHGLPTYCQDDLRIFPTSNRGSDVPELFESIFNKYSSSISLHLGTEVLSIQKTDDLYTVESKESNNRKSVTVDAVVITTGGNAYSHTGSSGDGYTFAQELGHTITPLGPSLSSFETLESFAKNLSGISLQNATLRVENIAKNGPILFTHFGITGPGVFSLSSSLAHVEITKDYPVNILVAPVSEMKIQEWDSFIEQACREFPSREVRNILSPLPHRFIEELIQGGFDPNKNLSKKATILSKECRKELAKLLGEGIPLTLTARRAGDEFVTAGGVELSEVNSETLESKLSKGLYFAGEVLDIDGVTGGFNLQVAWSTGYGVSTSLLQAVQNSYQELSV